VILLDTHAWIWWVSHPDRLPRKTRTGLTRTVNRGEQLRVSSISIWELAMLADRGRLTLTMDPAAWVAHAERLPYFAFVPVDNAIALRAVTLPDFPHRDPADRLIIATALGLGATLVTGDEQLHGYTRVRTLWG
jgi:PIN domain nuclease of toxin-antitoxin system